MLQRLTSESTKDGALLLNDLPHNHHDLSLDPQHTSETSYMSEHIRNPSTRSQRQEGPGELENSRFSKRPPSQKEDT